MRRTTSAVVADTTTLRRLGYRAVEEGWPSPSDKAFEDLDPGGQHIGVLVHVIGWDGTFDTEVAPDAVGIVTWALALDGREERVIVHIAAPVSEIAQLEEAAVLREQAEPLLNAARDYLASLKFQAQAQAELARILRGEFTDPDEQRP
jgi:hypothetical protein